MTTNATNLKALRGIGDLTLGEAILWAIGQARGLIEDHQPTEPDMQANLRTADDAYDRATWTPAEVAAIAEVVALGADYAANNNYGQDLTFPEDAAAARFLGDGDQAKYQVLESARLFAVS